MNDILSLQKGRPSASRPSSYWFLQEQKPKFGTDSMNLPRTHDLSARYSYSKLRLAYSATDSLHVLGSTRSLTWIGVMNNGPDIKKMEPNRPNDHESRRRPASVCYSAFWRGRCNLAWRMMRRSSHSLRLEHNRGGFTQTGRAR